MSLSLPSELWDRIYSYDSTHRENYDIVIKELGGLYEKGKVWNVVPNSCMWYWYFPHGPNFVGL